ncbi:MAG: cytidylate kinase family protein [Clostridia bacterium]|nr:cytidylate kinase family protein [Clostridia bacterium]
MSDKISLAGDLGSGKSTVSAILIEKLGAQYYSTGAIVREIAEKHGMTVGELNVYMETHPEIDHEIDDGLVRLSDDDRLLIIDSRMAWHFTKGTFKVYLSTDTVTSALRIMNANRVGEHAATLEETVAQTKARRESEKKRYFEQYGVNIKDLSNYSLIVDTTYATPDEIAAVIADGFAAWQKDNTFTSVMLSPKRLDLSAGEENGNVVVSEKDGTFTLMSGTAMVRAALEEGKTFIRAELRS